MASHSSSQASDAASGPKPRVVLLGSAGAGAAFAAATSLRRNWPFSVSIVAQDTNPAHLVTTSLISHHFAQCPASSSDLFAEHLLSVVARYNVDAYLPLVPAEVSVARRLAGDLESCGVRLLVADRSSPVELSDKWAFAGAAMSLGLPVPPTELGRLPRDGAWFFIKPRFGFGSRGTAKLSRADCERIAPQELGETLFQVVCEAPEVTVDAFVAPDDSYVFALARERLEVKSGVCVKARVFADQEMSEIAEKLANAFKLRGAFCFQVMRSEGRWVITDINPRPGAGTSMCQAVGCDFFAASFAWAWREDYRRYFSPIERPVFVTRQYADFLQGTPA